MWILRMFSHVTDFDNHLFEVQLKVGPDEIICGSPCNFNIASFHTKSKVLDWILIAMVLSFCPVSTAKTCPTETTVIKVGGDLFTVIWRTRHSSIPSIVISNPPCLDINNEVVFRFCLGGIWTQTSTCHYVDKKTLCPVSFDEEDDTCVYVTPPQRFNESCPYPGESSKVKEYNNIWLPVKQTVLYGLLEYITPDDRYGLEYSASDSSESSEEIFDFTSKCVVKKRDKIETASCDEKFSKVCVYKYDHRLYRCPDACVSGGLGSNYCFCKKSTDDFMYSKCDIVGFPNFEYERRIMYKLVGSDVCIIDKSHLFNFYIAISKNELHLKQLNAVNCAICKVATVPFEKVDLELKFNVKSYKLYLVVYSPAGLHKIDKKVLVYCFTDATSQLKKRSEVKLEYDSSIKNSSQRVYTIFQVSVSEDGPGFYWCEAFLLPNMTVIESNKVLAHKKLNYNEYSLRLHVLNLCKYSLVYCKMPNAEFFYDLSKTLFKDERFSFVKNVRLFRIYDVNVEIETADILLHVAVKSKVGFEEEYNMAKSNLEFLNNQNVTVISFSSSTHCLSETTFLSNSILHWQLTPLGTVVTPEEICLTKNQIPLRRKCDGDFYVGAIWQNVTNDCLTNNSVPLKTQFLHTFVVEDLPINLTVNISNFIDDVSDLTILDVHYLNKLLRRLSGSNLNDSKIFVSKWEIL
ncbi:hypothetical protein FQA39_LY02249 [Lamprigera yunnana]|nr:hypothetical protein FQA39_LY02249 [Lamprigera yunnana]